MAKKIAMIGWLAYADWQVNGSVMCLNRIDISLLAGWRTRRAAPNKQLFVRTNLVELTARFGFIQLQKSLLYLSVPSIMGSALPCSPYLLCFVSLRHVYTRRQCVRSFGYFKCLYISYTQQSQTHSNTDDLWAWCSCRCRYFHVVLLASFTHWINKPNRYLHIMNSI